MKIRHKQKGTIFTILNINQPFVFVIDIYNNERKIPYHEFLEKYQCLINCSEYFGAALNERLNEIINKAKGDL